MAEIPWDAIIELIKWLMEMMGLDKTSAIQKASNTFCVPADEIEKKLKNK